MDNFYTIRFKRNTAKRFKSFSKKVSKSYSDSMELIINFFEWHGFMPSDRFGKSLLQEIIKNRKRTDANIAILKDIEKSQTGPTNAMLLSLFEENVTEEASELVERKYDKKQPKESIEIETTVPKIRYDRLQDKMTAIQEDFSYVLENVKIVKSNFSKNYLKLEITEDELVKFKRTLKKL